MTFSVGVVTTDAIKVIDKVKAGMSATGARAVLKAANYAGGLIAEFAASRFKDSSGELPRSFLPARLLDVGSGDIAAGSLSDLPHARVQDEGSGYLPGGVVSPRAGRNLAIPLTAKARNMWPRDWPQKDLFVSRSKLGNLLLRESNGGRPQYLLRESVTIIGTNYISDANKEATPNVPKIIDAEMQANIDQAEAS